MARLLPPSPGRARAARALGLRPRSGLLILAGLAATCAAACEWGFGPAATWLSDHLDSVFLGGSPDLPESEGWSTAGLLGLIVALGIAVVIAFPRRRARAALGVSPSAERIAPAIVLAAIAAVALLVVTANLGVIAGAARSVDATTSTLTTSWLAWTRRGLLALAGAALGVGLIERRLSGRSLWRGLHQTPAHARREARASRRR